MRERKCIMSTRKYSRSKKAKLGVKMNETRKSTLTIQKTSFMHSTHIKYDFNRQTSSLILLFSPFFNSFSRGVCLLRFQAPMTAWAHLSYFSGCFFCLSMRLKTLKWDYGEVRWVEDPKIQFSSVAAAIISSIHTPVHSYHSTFNSIHHELPETNSIKITFTPQIDCVLLGREKV